jgi:hypothetical protein
MAYWKPIAPWSEVFPHAGYVVTLLDRLSNSASVTVGGG